MNWRQKMNDSTDLRNRILQMREANNLNIVSEKSEHVDEKVISKENITIFNNKYTIFKILVQKIKKEFIVLNFQIKICII